MALDVQVVLDCRSPRGLAPFWRAALGYVDDAPPPGFADWDEALRAWGVPESEWDSRWALVDPDGRGPRLYFQRVPEDKAGKNRLHLDLRAGGPRGTPVEERWPRVLAKEAELLALGATRLREVHEGPDRFLVLADPEGNELCLT